MKTSSYNAYLSCSSGSNLANDKTNNDFPKSQLTSHLTKWKVIERVTAIKETIPAAIKSNDWDGNYPGWSTEINTEWANDIDGRGEKCRRTPISALALRRWIQLIKRESTEWFLIIESAYAVKSTPLSIGLEKNDFNMSERYMEWLNLHRRMDYSKL